jgi:hypothetical protein
MGGQREDARGQPLVSAATLTWPRFGPALDRPGRRDHPFLGCVRALGRDFVRFDSSGHAGADGWPRWRWPKPTMSIYFCSLVDNGVQIGVFMYGKILYLLLDGI